MLVATDKDRILQRIDLLYTSVPSSWRAQCALPPAVAAPSAVPLIVSRLGWRLPLPSAAAPEAVGRPVMLKGLTVRMGTALQMGQVLEARRACHTAFVRLALEQPPVVEPAAAVMAAFGCRLQSAWRLKWDNHEKQVLWRLAVDGVAAANSRMRSWSCPCCPGAGGDPRAHCFWDCPVAVAVWRELLAGLPQPSTPLARASVWLGAPVPASVHAGVWGVVCLAALSAMEHGRRQLWRLTRAAAEHAVAATLAAGTGGRQRTIPELLWGAAPPLPPPRASAVDQAKALAVADFWMRLESFATLGLAPASWAAQVGAAHPFLCSGGLALRCPAVAPAPPAAAAVAAAVVPAAAAAAATAVAVVPAAAAAAAGPSFRQHSLPALWRPQGGVVQQAPHVPVAAARPCSPRPVRVRHRKPRRPRRRAAQQPAAVVGGEVADSLRLPPSLAVGVDGDPRGGAG